ncbi:MAG TPA: metalloregulator ArsR/SmtB family transcription factor [Candidatus Dormibacteraeota bacterium]|nr:metalloregulator ArsR/SmtB family transcription factor [Candidatus Dormibacteraeota bacterium]
MNKQAHSKRMVAAVSSMARVLGDPTRLAVLAYLAQGDACVCDIVDALGVSQPLLSHHLRALKEAGLVRDRRAGRWVYYALVHQPLDVMTSFIAELQAGFPARRRDCR